MREREIRREILVYAAGLLAKRGLISEKEKDRVEKMTAMTAGGRTETAADKNGEQEEKNGTGRNL